MDGIEIVITPRTVERTVLGIIILILTVLLILNLGDNCKSSEELTTNNDTTELAVAKTSEIETAQSQSTATNSCENGVKDASETDIDCGGECGTCGEYKACNMDKDCSEGLYCFQRIKCLAPSCDDGVKNQDETEIDCGGTCGGYYWRSDSECHDEEEASGLLEVSVDADIDRSPNSGSAIIKTISLDFKNGLGKAQPVEATIYARTSSGGIIFDNKEGEIPIATQTYSLKDGEKVVKSIELVNNTRSTLPGIKSTDKFQIVVELRDTQKKNLLDEITWVNQ